jgi:hypothetical protein
VVSLVVRRGCDRAAGSRRLAAILATDVVGYSALMRRANFADGMVEEIITALSRFKWLFVIARNSSFTYKGRAVDIKGLGASLACGMSLRHATQRQSGGREADTSGERRGDDDRAVLDLQGKPGQRSRGGPVDHLSAI